MVGYDDIASILYFGEILKDTGRKDMRTSFRRLKKPLPITTRNIENACRSTRTFWKEPGSPEGKN